MVTLASQIIVLAFGTVILVGAAWGIVDPDTLMTFVRSTMERRWGIYVAVIGRLILGTALLGVAPVSVQPTVFYWLGVITIIAAGILLIAGRERAHRLLDWWAERVYPTVTRVWSLLGAAFGVFLLYGAS